MAFVTMLVPQPSLLAQPTPSHPTVQPLFWQQPLLFIPYQLNKQATGADKIDQVQLLVSRTGHNDWQALQSAKSNVLGFSYHAPEEGTYWFALRHLDAQGNSLDAPTAAPQLQIVIDTTQPTLDLTAAQGTNGEVIIRYEAVDTNLVSSSLIVEARTSDGLWTNVPLAAPDLAQPDRLVGRVRWTAPSDNDIEVRGAIADRAGHRRQATTMLSLSGPSLSMPDRTPDLPPNVAQQQINLPQTSQRQVAQDWPTSNQLPTKSPAQTAINSVSKPDNSLFAPPQLNPYANTSQQHGQRRTPATFAVDGAADSDQPADRTIDSGLAPSLNSEGQVPTGGLPREGEPEWTSSGRQPGEPILMNSRTFDVEYDLQSVGPWGVAKVELWGTQDGGSTWQSYGNDPDNRSPVRARVPGAGVYGFRIVVDGANGAASPPPRSGDEPELVITVDLEPPSAELLSAKMGTGNLNDHLQIRWNAEDDNLEQRPIGLYFSSQPSGPWSAIAAGLENTGSYTWRVERHIPIRFYIRLEVRDTAGNVATFQTPEPLELNRPQPTGHLRDVRPITGVPRVSPSSE
ncbi:hypothetical protein [Bythopirellula goksoeyrii]|uniref:Ser-Thr-rich glycosyl-phosphatidyl-inositol-anchored membrane family protein n=1 Tax=Bythopirellula goksoeyrii TaxID=1400387 RepID=A0A5B9QSM0_9BACT|nr:hypothetical protein [Bythopirellula goksoeyrii]QEG36903.1 hypothetical protein Pr1d_42420 [Bythopirellula goksoeyrii]